MRRPFWRGLRSYNFTLSSIFSMITYVITIAKRYPSYHEKAGQPTNFRQKILAGEKIHTIRENSLLWMNRFYKIYTGQACLSLREWVGAPYKSKQVEIARLTKDDGIAITEVIFFKSGPFVGGIPHPIETVAKNDGLSENELKSWFPAHKGQQQFALIYFNNFRY